MTKEPKTAASRCTRTLPHFAVDVPTALKAALMKAALLAGPVFCTRTGGDLRKKNVLRAFHGLVKKVNAGISADAERAAGAQVGTDALKGSPGRSRFRGTFGSTTCGTVASLLLSKGHSLKAVSQHLGHANPTTMLSVCAHDADR